MVTPDLGKVRFVAEREVGDSMGTQILDVHSKLAEDPLNRLRIDPK